MADVVEVIHKINYEVNDTSLNKATYNISLQLKELDALNKMLAGYKQQLNTTADAKYFDTVAQKADTTTQKIKAMAAKLQGAMAEIGKGAAKGLNIPTSTADLVEQAVGMLKDFAVESGHIAEQATQAELAFQKLNRVDLLDDLRKATQGTVSDLELMQQAVQYEKIGVPVDKLAIAMGFANMRALQTGESVDDLSRGIVQGIQNKSLPALGELGINTTKVKDEFERTGNFAQAAFNVIKSETVEAGKNLDAFAQKQAEINTSITNTQQSFGNFYNTLKGGVYAFGQDVYQMATEPISYAANFAAGGKDNLGTYIDKVGAQKKQKEVNITIDKEASKIYNSYFKNLSDRYQNADKQQRHQVRKMADVAFQRAVRDFEKSGRKKIPNAANIFGRLLNQAFNKLQQELNSSIDKPSKIFTPTRRTITPTPKPEDRPSFKGNFGPNEKELDTLYKPDPEKPSTEASDRLMRQTQEAKDNDADLQLKTKANAEAKRKSNVKQAIDDYKQLTQAAVDAYNTITNAQIAALDKEIAIREKRVDAATKLAERGNTEALRIEEERLNKAQKKREEIARKQMIVNAALAISNAIAGIAETATTGPGAIVLIPAVIAAIVAGYAAVTAVTKESTEQAFADGVVGYRGKGGARDDMNRVWISNGESVITAEGTAKNRALLEAINKGGQFGMLYPQLNAMQQVQPAGAYASHNEMQNMEKKMDALIDAVTANGTTVHANVDERGLSLMTVKQIKRDQNRFR
ncbi:MAG: hypothetical protein EOP51_04085 [Sphingobacteriales bacterium]|nr:MAG: hypothetical protein EOP51_04085 [Sphingobacteriales bacterium]